MRADVSHLSDRELSLLRAREIGFVFQQFFLAEHATVRENVADGLLYAGIPAAERYRRADEALERVGLSDRAKFKPTMISGGERQRVAIARALVGHPAIVLADGAQRRWRDHRHDHARLGSRRPVAAPDSTAGRRGRRRHRPRARLPGNARGRNENEVRRAMSANSGRLRPNDWLRVGSVGLRARPMRAALSALGIAIGTAAIVGVLGLSSSSQAGLLAQIDQLGTNMLTAEAGQSLTGGVAQLPLEAPARITHLGNVAQVAHTPP
jgi:hypothetical protein